MTVDYSAETAWSYPPPSAESSVNLFRVAANLEVGPNVGMAFDFWQDAVLGATE